MLDETEPLLEDIENDRQCNTGFFRSVYNYMKQPRFWDWVIVAILIGAVIATIIICA